jgi:hypothetical protein
MSRSPLNRVFERHKASMLEVRNWALSTGFEIGSDGTIPGQAITAYNQTDPTALLNRNQRPNAATLRHAFLRK